MVAVCVAAASMVGCAGARGDGQLVLGAQNQCEGCLLYTSDAADDLLCVDLGGRRIIKKKTINTTVS